LQKKKRIMGLIQRIKDLLGLSAIEMVLKEQERNQKYQREQQDAFLEAIKSLTKQHQTAPAVPSVPTVSPVSPLGQSGQVGQSGEVEELRKQLEICRKQVEGLQVLLAQSKENAVKEYLAAAKEVVKKASEPGAVGRPALPGTKINLKIEEHLYAKICFLKESVPGFKVTAFCNAAIARSLATFYDEHPELLQVLQKHVDEE
jgi:hypothetical protein